MIRPPGFAGAAFGTAAAGDLRRDREARARVAAELGISSDWAYLNQVHGNAVVVAGEGGNLGDGDALIALEPGIPIMVATADCVPIIIEADDAVAVVHAGWRGAAVGVVERALETLASYDREPRRAAIGPAIGPCCYEVGQEVVEQFPGFVEQTIWGTPSVDIAGYLAEQMHGLDVWRSAECTFESKRLYSWRGDRTEERQVAVAWLPNG